MYSCNLFHILRMGEINTLVLSQESIYYGSEFWCQRFTMIVTSNKISLPR